MFLLGVLCAVLVALLTYSMPYGSPPLEPDGSISMTTMHKYGGQGWKIPWIIGAGIGVPIFVALGCWRWFHRKKGADVHTTTA
jgi:hypothetical protein